MVLPVVLLPRPAAGATVTPLAAAATSAGNPRGPLTLAIGDKTTVQELVWGTRTRGLGAPREHRGRARRGALTTNIEVALVAAP
ncbi:MAG: hypothetical protein IPI49_14380 [Myxococcales bacterium]|nr:hypothetical protein [Myxococcales bacterium]